MKRSNKTGAAKAASTTPAGAATTTPDVEVAAGEVAQLDVANQKSKLNDMISRIQGAGSMSAERLFDTLVDDELIDVEDAEGSHGASIKMLGVTTKLRGSAFETLQNWANAARRSMMQKAA